MWILLWIVFGAFIGWIASMITGNNASMGALANIVVGLLGAIVGGWIATLLGFGTYAEFSMAGILMAILGAVVLLWIVNMFTRRTVS